MRELTVVEMEEIEGGNPVIVAVTIVGAVFAFGYKVGADMAARDAAREADSN